MKPKPPHCSLTPFICVGSKKDRTEYLRTILQKFTFCCCSAKADVSSNVSILFVVGCDLNAVKVN